MDDEYIRKTDLMLDLLDKRNELNKIIQKTRNELRELKKRQKGKKLINKFSPFTIFIITKRKDFVK